MLAATSWRVPMHPHLLRLASHDPKIFGSTWQPHSRNATISRPRPAQKLTQDWKTTSQPTSQPALGDSELGYRISYIASFQLGRGPSSDPRHRAKAHLHQWPTRFPQTRPAIVVDAWATWEFNGLPQKTWKNSISIHVHGSTSPLGHLRS